MSGFQFWPVDFIMHMLMHTQSGPYLNLGDCPMSDIVCKVAPPTACAVGTPGAGHRLGGRAEGIGEVGGGAVSAFAFPFAPARHPLRLVRDTKGRLSEPGLGAPRCGPSLARQAPLSRARPDPARLPSPRRLGACRARGPSGSGPAGPACCCGARRAGAAGAASALELRRLVTGGRYPSP